MDGSGVEVLVGTDELPPAEEEPGGIELLGMAEVELMVDSTVLVQLLIVLLPVEVVVAEVEVPVLDVLLQVSLVVVVVVVVPLLAEVVVSMAGTEIGWPTAEHWDTTALETAIKALVEIIQLPEYGHTNLVWDLATLLNTRSHGANKGGLLAVAGKVGQGGAAIGS